MTDGPSAQELRELVDRGQVTELINRYISTIDERVPIDVEWARSLFSEDVRVEHRGFVMEGLEAIAFGHQVVVDGWERTLHFTTNPQIDLDGDRASLTARLFAIHHHRDGDPPEPYFVANIFTAEAIRTPDGWRFTTMKQDTQWSRGQSHLDVQRSEG